MSIQPSLGNGPGRVPERIAGLYAAFGLLWIWLGDSALIWLGFEDNHWFLAGAVKGTAFVSITAVFLYWLVRREVGAARQSENLLRAVVEGTTDAVFVKDVEGRYLLFNEAASAFVGQPVAAVLGRDDTVLFNAADAARIIANDRAVMANGKVVTLEETITAGAVTRTYQATKAPFRDEAGNVIGLIGISRDITEARRANQALQESEERFRTMADAAPVLIWLADTTGGCVWFNRQWLEFVGRSLESVFGAGWEEGVHPDDRARRLGTYQAAFDSRQPFMMDYRLRRHDGEYRWVLDSGVPRLTEGEFVGYIGSCVDITDRKVAEEALRDSETRLRTLADAIPQMVWTADQSGALTHVNTETALYTGLDSLKLVGWAWEVVIHPEDLELVKSEWVQTIDDGLPRPVEMRIRRADGEFRWHICRQRSIRNAAGEIASWVGTNTDIDDLKQAENALRETDARLLEAQRIARLGSWAWVPSTNDVWWSDAEFELFGADRLTVQPSFEEFLAHLHPDDRGVAYARVEAMLGGENEFANDLRIVRPNGEIIWIHSRARATRDPDGKILRVEGTDQDVTARRMAELAAYESERRLQSAIEVAELGVIDIDYVNDSATLSTRAAEQFGFPSELSVSRVDLHARFHPDDQAELEQLTASALDPAGTGWFALEHRVVRPDGTIRWLNVRKQVSFSNQRPLKAVVVTLDVTSRRLAEETLRASELRYRVMFESNPHPMWDYNIDSFRFLAVNDAAVLAYGYTRDEFLSMSIRDIRPDDDVQRLELAVAQLTSGPTRSSPWRHKRKNGTVFDVDVSSHNLPDGNGRTRLVMALDITERLQAEQTRDELLARLQLHIDRMPLAYVLFDASMRYADWNPAAERIFGYSRDEAIGQSLQFLVHPDDRLHVEAISARLQSGDVTAHSINRNLTKDGRIIVCEWHNTPLFDANGAFLGVLSMTSDITDRVRREEALRESERRLRLALEAAGAIAFTWDIKCDTVTRFFSTEPALPVTAERLGTLDDVRTRIHFDDLSSFDARLSASMVEGSDYRNQYRVVRPDGTSATLEEYGYIDRAADGTPLLLTGISIDISDRVAAIDALRVSEERYRRLVAVLPTAVLVHDGENILYCNPGWCNIGRRSCCPTIL